MTFLSSFFFCNRLFLRHFLLVGRAPPCTSGVVGECFSFDLAQIEPAVGLGEVDDRVHLLMDKRRVIAHDRTADDRQLLAVLGLYLGNRKIEPAFQPPHKTFDDTAFLLEGLDPVQMNMYF